MMPRLHMMWKMLKPTGVIAICIDDNELFHLGMMMNEVFGEENRIEIINWQKSYFLKMIVSMCQRLQSTYWYMLKINLLPRQGYYHEKILLTRSIKILIMTQRDSGEVVMRQWQRLQTKIAMQFSPLLQGHYTIQILGHGQTLKINEKVVRGLGLNICGKEIR